MKNQRNHARHLLSSILALIALTIVTTFGLGSLAPAHAQATTPSWTYTGSLNTGRVFHTATMLPNGKVLVTGGQSGALAGYQRPLPKRNIGCGLPHSPTGSASRTKFISRLNTQPALSPVNASPSLLRATPHDSGSSWLARPLTFETFIQ